jgi:5-methylcytosine-specific restriction endonuclease McrA
MTRLAKNTPYRMDSITYQQLRALVLRRDGWRCQACGGMTNLEIHHRQFRSRQGEDTEQNLVTLCSECHKRAH